MLRLVNRDGEARIDDITQEFRAFYVQRKHSNLPVEFKVALLSDPEEATLEAVKELIIKYPLERFVLNGFLEYDSDAGIVRFSPSLWHELRFYELLDILAAADEQLRFYYERSQTS